MSERRIQFEAELVRVRREVLAMAARVEEDLAKAIESLKTRDAELAGKVMADDGAVNAMQARVQDMAAVLIATQQPVAGDMRELVADIRMADELERIGDYAVHLAKTAVRLKDAIWPRQFAILAEMGELGRGMIRDMSAAFERKDAKAAADCAARDERIDDLHHALMAMTMDGLKADPGKADEAVKLIRTSGFLERLGDHVTNACELVAYAASGERVEYNA